MVTPTGIAEWMLGAPKPPINWLVSPDVSQTQGALVF